jgi:hypothetical protein
MFGYHTFNLSRKKSTWEKMKQKYDEAKSTARNPEVEVARYSASAHTDKSIRFPGEGR